MIGTFFKYCVQLNPLSVCDVSFSYNESTPVIKNYLKIDGQVGIVVPSVYKEFEGEISEHLRPYWEPYLFTHHSADWWKAIWERSWAVDVKTSDYIPDGYENWLKWDKTLKEAGIFIILSSTAVAISYIAYQYSFRK